MGSATGKVKSVRDIGNHVAIGTVTGILNYSVLKGVQSVDDAISNAVGNAIGKSYGGVKNAIPEPTQTSVTATESANSSATEAVSKGGTATIPDKAVDIANKIKTNSGVAPQGYKGGRTFKNIPLEEGAQKLPEGVNYKEYDVNPFVKGQNRGAERLVIGDDDTVWYTNDHYKT